MIPCSPTKLKILSGYSQTKIKKRARKRQSQEAILGKVKEYKLMTIFIQKSTILLMRRLRQAKIGKLLAVGRSIQVIQRIQE